VKKVKLIKINVDKCSGCRACEVACSAFHSTPKYSGINAHKSRIYIVADPIKDVFVPVMSGEYTEAECNGRGIYTINGKNYDECDFCRASCPARERFKDPDSGLPLKCDMCEEEPPLAQPMCVKWCLKDALTYEEREEEGEESNKPGEMEIGLQELVKKHGIKKIKDTITRINKE
jgi:benzoyl-CoA reductase subunit BamC